MIDEKDTDKDTDQDTSKDTANIETNVELDMTLLDLLVCPVTHETLHYDRQNHELISKGAGLAFPIRDGIPILLAEEARRLSE
jgi:uncharacterized protein YbaR (Trm112 family)